MGDSLASLTHPLAASRRRARRFRDLDVNYPDRMDLLAASGGVSMRGSSWGLTLYVRRRNRYRRILAAVGVAIHLL